MCFRALLCQLQLVLLFCYCRNCRFNTVKPAILLPSTRLGHRSSLPLVLQSLLPVPLLLRNEPNLVRCCACCHHVTTADGSIPAFHVVAYCCCCLALAAELLCLLRIHLEILQDTHDETLQHVGFAQTE